MSSTTPSSRTVVLVGAGPRALSVLERLVANLVGAEHDLALDVHLVDPYPVGAGRIWRDDQSPLLWMNSVAEDVTLFTDDSVPIEGPVRPGPSLWQWIASADAAPDLDERQQQARLDARTFPARRVQTAYLTWVLERVLQQAGDRVRVLQRRASAVDLRVLPDGREEVQLSDGGRIVADAVILTQGHLDVVATDEERRFADFAARHGGVFVGTGYTADVDLDGVPEREWVLVRGLGLAFVDLVALVTLGRDGAFERVDGALRYRASGREPRLIAGSGRGVPYRSKLGYAGPEVPPRLPRYLTADAVRARTGGGAVDDFVGQVWPLVVKDLGHAHYGELFRAHPERVSLPWGEFERAYDAVDWGSDEFDRLVVEAVPKTEDRFDVVVLDRPLRGVRVSSVDALQGLVREHVRADLARRHDPYFSADTAVFVGLLQTYAALGALAVEGLLPPDVIATEVEGRWHSFFSYVASGPPGRRLEELLALVDAGLVVFAGADLTVRADETTGEFVATSSSHPDELRARTLVEARLPEANVELCTDPLVTALRDRGELVSNSGGRDLPRTKVLARPGDQRLVGADGAAQPTRFALGPWVTGGAASAAFARPGVGAGFFRQNDAVARAVIDQVSGGVA
jgi:uncharacterized NAD(P)/FAD-binding protein YdhS